MWVPAPVIIIIIIIINNSEKNKRREEWHEQLPNAKKTKKKSEMHPSHSLTAGEAIPIDLNINSVALNKRHGYTQHTLLSLRHPLSTPSLFFTVFKKKSCMRRIKRSTRLRASFQ